MTTEWKRHIYPNRARRRGKRIASVGDDLIGHGRDVGIGDVPNQCQQLRRSRRPRKRSRSPGRGGAEVTPRKDPFGFAQGKLLRRTRLGSVCVAAQVLPYGEIRNDHQPR